MDSALIKDAQYLASGTTLAQLPGPAFAEIAFAGRSNVGKSSLINSLTQRKRLVRTSGTPGCTRGINLFRIDLKTVSKDGESADAVIDFVDLPGYGYAKRSKTERRSWGPMIESFLTGRPGLRAVIVIVDLRRGLEEDDRQLIDFLKHIDRRVILVATKSDKLPRNQRKLRVKEIQKDAKVRVYGYSSSTSEGRDELLAALLRAAHISAA